VSLGEPLAGEPPQWSFRVYHKPYVSWIWLGAVFMVLGGGLAAFDRRYRQVQGQTQGRLDGLGARSAASQGPSALNAGKPSSAGLGSLHSAAAAVKP
jgi:cytochrome c-type biogenesis protein CcmF